MYRFKKIAPFAAAVLVIATFAALLKPQVARSVVDTKNTLNIHVRPLQAQNLEITSQYVGYVVPVHAVDLVPNVSGYIDEIWAVGGQHVKSGDNLVMIDQRQYKAQLDASKAAVIQAEATYHNAQSYYQRLKKAGKHAVSASDLDEAKAKYLAAEAALAQAKAEEQNAAVLYDYTLLQAPIDGVIGNVSLTKGDYTTPNSKPLLSIVQYDPIRVVFALSDKEYLAQRHKYHDKPLFSDEKIKIRLADNSLYDAEGQFQFTDNKIDKSTNSVSIYADFENKQQKLMANSYVDILLQQELKNVFLIRQNFANLTDKGVFAYIMHKRKLSQVPLQIVGYYQDSYVVKNRFDTDDYLVIDRIGNIPPDTVLNMIIETPAEKK